VLLEPVGKPLDMVRFEKTVQAVDDLPLEITHWLYWWDAGFKKGIENLFQPRTFPLEFLKIPALSQSEPYNGSREPAKAKERSGVNPGQAITLH
jgi:hypothetical protein